MEAASPQELDRWRALEQMAETEGLAWADSSCAELSRQGRSIAGGWPGTLSQARQRVALCMTAQNRSRGLVLSAADIQWLARTVYLTAKAEWLARAEPGEGE